MRPQNPLTIYFEYFLQIPSDIWRKDSLWSITGNRLQRTDQICTLGNIEKNVFEMCLFVSNNQRALLAKWNYLTDFAIISTAKMVWSNYITLRTILRSWMDCTSKMSESFPFSRRYYHCNKMLLSKIYCSKVLLLWLFYIFVGFCRLPFPMYFLQIKFSIVLISTHTHTNYILAYL